MIAILALLVALLPPVLGRVRENAQSAKCQSHLRVLHSAAVLYAQEHDMRLPHTQIPSKYWFNQIAPYAESAGGLSEVFRCPVYVPTTPRNQGILAASWNNRDCSAVAFNAGGVAHGQVRMVNIEHPSQHAFLFVGSRASNFGAFSGATLRDGVSARAGDRPNFAVVFWDGHVETFRRPTELSRWTELYNYLTSRAPRPEWL